MSMVSLKMKDSSTGSIVESTQLNITSNAVHVSDQAVHPGEDSTLDRTWGGPKCTYAVSISTGTVKATPGVLFGFWGGTAGTMAVKDGANLLGIVTISANVIVSLATPIACATSITISASAAVATVLYL
jgi:hypothetical protein